MKVAQYTLEINQWLTRLSLETNEYLIKYPHQGDLVNYCQNVLPISIFTAHEGTQSQRADKTIKIQRMLSQ